MDRQLSRGSGFRRTGAALGSSFANADFSVSIRGEARERSGDRLAQQLHDSREFFFGTLFDRHAEDIGMAEPQGEPEVERVIVAAIYRHTRGNIIYLARAIVADLREAGFEIRRADAIPIRRNPGG